MPSKWRIVRGLTYDIRAGVRARVRGGVRTGVRTGATEDQGYR